MFQKLILSKVRFLVKDFRTKKTNNGMGYTRQLCFLKICWAPIKVMAITSLWAFYKFNIT
jgi:hypothetical protein